MHILLYSISRSRTSNVKVKYKLLAFSRCVCNIVGVRGSKRFAFKSSDCKICVFLFLVRLTKRKCYLEKPHKYWIL